MPARGVDVDGQRKRIRLEKTPGIFSGYEYLSGYGRLRIEDVNEDSGPGRGVGFSHDLLDVFAHGLLANLKGVRDLLVGPPLCQVLKNGLFAIGQLELFLGLNGHPGGLRSIARLIDGQRPLH